MTKKRWLEISAKAFELHSRKGADYSEKDLKDVLGIRGRFSDIFRKVARLKTALWDRKDLQVNENVEDTSIDLLVYSFMLYDELTMGADYGS